MDDFSIILEDEIKENETIIWHYAQYLEVTHCTYKNCHIVIRGISNITFTKNNFINCTFDLDLSDTTGYVDINDNFISYPGNLQALEECRPKVVPVSGDFYAYKFLRDEDGGRYIAKLLIPAEARRSSAGGKKCRAEKALVIDIWRIKSWTKLMYNSTIYYVFPETMVLHRCLNINGKNIKYEIGSFVIADEWDNNRFAECAHGIHFYLDLETVVENFITHSAGSAENIINDIKALEKEENFIHKTLLLSEKKDILPDERSKED